MMDSSKYRVGYFPVDKKYNKWVEKDHIEKAPVWCSVDMRDGNQSLVISMSLEEKLEYYKVLLQVGFKEIEVGFPAASDTEYEFLRTLIDNNMIPGDVTVQVLTQCREHIIRKTFDACKGAPSAIIHFYNSVSVAQREQVFKKSKEEIKQIAVDGAKLVKKLANEYEGNFRFEYSPESFNVDTDVIIPARYLNTPDAKELALHCMEDIDTEFVKKVKAGDIMVAGWNFGCGSSREHAPLVIKTCGTGCVIAKSFARIFYRNAINIGLPILECEEAAEEISANDEVKVDFDTGVITNITTGKTYKAQPFPPFIQNIIRCGGLLKSLKEGEQNG